MKNIKRVSVLPEKNIVKFFKYFRNISFTKYFAPKNFMKFYITSGITQFCVITSRYLTMLLKLSCCVNRSSDVFRRLWCSYVSHVKSQQHWCLSADSAVGRQPHAVCHRSRRELHLPVQSASQVCYAISCNYYTVDKISLNNSKGKGKGQVLDIALLDDEHMFMSVLQSRKWQLTGIS